MQYVPIGSHVLIQRDPTEEKTRKGIILPDGSKKLALRGVVRHPGDGGLKKDGSRREPVCREGMVVIFQESRTIGPMMEVDKEERLFIVNEEDVLCCEDDFTDCSSSTEFAIRNERERIVEIIKRCCGKVGITSDDIIRMIREEPYESPTTSSGWWHGTHGN